MSRLKKQVTLKLSHYEAEGVSLIKTWGGALGSIKMNSIKIDADKDIVQEIDNFSVENLNDGGFGCEYIKGGFVEVNAVYGSSHKEHVASFYVGNLTDAEEDSLRDHFFIADLV